MSRPRCVRFVVPGVPVAQPRHKVGAGRSGGRPRAYVDRSHPVHAHRAACRLAALAAFAGRPFAAGVPVELTLDFYLPRPRRLVWKSRPMPAAYCASRPDASNLAKAVEDAVNEVAFADDGQVAVLVARKWYAAGGDAPRTEARVRELAR